MVDEPTKRPSWLTIGVLGAAASVVVYVFVIGSEIGTMKQKVTSNELRITALEVHGSGPVQATAEKVNAVTQRADRILTEVLLMQKLVSDLAANQQAQGVAINRLQEDLAKGRTP